MKKLFLLSLFLIVLGDSFAQIVEPVKWSTQVKKISATEYELQATATIDDKWHLYSQSVPEGGPVATIFTFKSNPNFLKKGNTKEGEGHTVYDKIFEMNIKYFEKKATFKQRIKLKKQAPFKVNAQVRFMVCDDSRCLPPTMENLVFDIK